MEAYMLSPDHLVVAGVLNDIMVYSFRTMFFLSAVLLMAIVLMQEGKGGGLASALGGQGAETFGVSTGGVNKVTLFLAGLFLFSALGHALSFEQSVVAGLKGPKKAAQDGGGGASGGGGTDEEKVKKAPEDAIKEGETKPVEPPKDEPKKEEPPKDTPVAPPVKEDPPK